MERRKKEHQLLTMRLSIEDRMMLEGQAQRVGMTKSAYIRMLLRKVQRNGLVMSDKIPPATRTMARD